MTLEHLGKPLKIGGRTAANRIVYQPTESDNCDDRGSPTEETLRRYSACAAGGPGIVHVESVDVTRRTQARRHRMLLMEENVPAVRRMVEQMRRINPEPLVIFQLSHAGRLSDPSLKPGLAVYDIGDPAVKVMSTAEVEELREEFAAAARRAWQAGADGVDFKQAHGFIGGDFLHPANDRADRYGGSFENRTRFFRETLKRMRQEVPDRDFLIGSRVSPYEGVPGGCGTSGPEEVVEDLTEPIRFAQVMEREGIDFINVSAGFASANLEILMPTAGYPEGVFRHFGWTRAIKRAVSVPVIGSGYSHLRDGENALHIPGRERRSLLWWAEKNLGDGNVDLIGVGRQSIADAGFAAKVLGGRADEVRWCRTCGSCGALLGAHKAVGCAFHDPRFKRLLDG